tara:strand:+ start:120 stop:251 length:132 start_codon:yes stop_codon:yes gene_type:complete
MLLMPHFKAAAMAFLMPFVDSMDSYNTIAARWNRKQILYEYKG